MDARKALITGITGFAGMHLAEYCLSQGATVVGASRSALDGTASQKPLFEGIELRNLDLEDAQAVQATVAEVEPTHIFHLAAQASVRHSWTDPIQTIVGNLTSTWNILDACREFAPQARAVVACSGEQYGPVSRAQLPVTEATPFRPQNPYALSKAQADLMAGFFADSHGLDVIRARAFNHTGPGQSDHYVAGRFARQVAEAELAGDSPKFTVVTGNIDVRRDFTDVRDVVRAYWLLAERAEPGAYNVCSGRSLPVGELLDVLDEITDLQLTYEVDPAQLRQSEVMEIRGSFDRLHDATGWRPEVPLKQTMTDTLNWWRAKLSEGAS